LQSDLSIPQLAQFNREQLEAAISARVRTVPAILFEYNAARYADPRGFLEVLLAAYGGVKSIGWDGGLESVSLETIVTERFGEDWLLFFSRTWD
jgi:hypothetical protein